MKDYKTIEKGRRTAYSGAEYVTFFTRVSEAINAVGIDKLNISAVDYAEFESQLAIMVKITQRTDTRVLTSKMIEADKEREHAFQYFQGVVKASAFSMGDSIRKCATTLLALLEKYKEMIYVKADQRTALMLGLFDDLGAEPYSDAVFNLGLDAAVMDMSSKNAEYESLNKERIDRKEEIKLPQSRSLRAVISPLYDKFCTLIEATYMLSTDAGVALEIDKLITDLSAIAEQMAVSYKKSQAQRKKTKPDGDQPAG